MEVQSYAKTFFLTNNGCIRRKIDAQHIIDFLLRNGYRKINEPENADLLFFVSCASDNVSEEVAINAVYDLEKRKKKLGKLFVIGCLSKINPQSLNNILDINNVIGPAEMHNLDKIFPEFEFPFKNIPEPYCISKGVFHQEGLIFHRGDFNKKFELNFFDHNIYVNNLETQYEEFKSKSSIIRIARGCLSHCKYCCIRHATGRLVSRSINEILEQFRNILSTGSSYFTITAEDVGAYGLDIGVKFPELLSGIAELDDNIELAVNAFNPRWIIPFLGELDKVLNETNILKHIVAPIQSGSDFILSRMGRGHSIDDGLHFFEVFEKFSDKIHVYTHLIVGFPGERPVDVDDTIKFMKRFPKIHYYIYPYNDRPGTVSSNFKGKIPDNEIQKRINLINEVKMELMNRV